MLTHESRTGAFDRPWTPTRRLATAAMLLGATAAVMSLRGPARGGEDRPAGDAEARPGASASPTLARSSPLFYTRAGTSGVMVVRPAAAARHAGMGRIIALLDDLVGVELAQNIAQVAKELRVDPKAPGFRRIEMKDLDWITFGITFGRTKNTKEPQHTIAFGTPAARTLAPFDWLAFLRQWRLEPTEVREGGGVYYRLAGPLAAIVGPNACVYLPDDRTIVLDEEKVIRKLAVSPSPPDFLRGPDWERTSRGLVALAIDNRGGALAKGYDLGRPDDATTLSLLKGVESWTFGIDDSEALIARASAACAGADASQALARIVEALVKQGRDEFESDVRKTPPAELAGHDRFIRMTRDLLAGLRVEPVGRSVALGGMRLGTTVDLVALIEDEARSAAKSRDQKEVAKPSKP